MNIRVDGDLFRYRCAFAAERTEYTVVYTDSEFDEETRIACEDKRAANAVRESLVERGIEAVIEGNHIVEPVEAALYNAKSMLRNAVDAVEGNLEDVIVVLSGADNYRLDLATTKPYKGNRDPNHQPVHGPAVKQYFIDNYNTVVTENEEADDYLGYMQCADIAEHGDWSCCIVTCDKDLDMIPGLHYNFLHDRAYFVDPWEADEFFWKQMITGDHTDNIPGIPGMGDKRAQAVMDDCATLGELQERVFALYVQHYPDSPMETFIEQGRLLWIRRKPGELWEPPKHIGT